MATKNNKILLFSLLIGYEITSKDKTFHETLSDCNIENIRAVHNDAGTMPYYRTGLLLGFLDGMKAYDHFRQKQYFDFHTDVNAAKNLTSHMKFMNATKQPFIAAKYCLGHAYLGSLIVGSAGVIINRDKFWEAIQKHILK